MNTLVIYGSHYGNTRKVAEAIANELAPRAQLVSVEEAARAMDEDVDLLVVGGPTEGHRMTDAVARFLQAIDAPTVKGKAVAAFDTRLRWPRWLSGSAASGIADSLIEAGGVPIAPPESFFVGGKATMGEVPELEPGELERAARWARTLAEKMERRLAEVR
jgi:flavodoxin